MSEQDRSITQEQKDAVAFLTLITTYQQIAWVSLGKLANPQTNSTERDLPQAQWAIDMLGMIERRTKGNLAESEARSLRQILYTLRMNYVEEANKPEEKAEETDTASGEQAPESAADKPDESATEERS